MNSRIRKHPRSSPQTLLCLGLLGLSAPAWAAAPLGFAPPVNTVTSPGPEAVTVGDFNADGRLDAITANPSDNSLSVLLGNGAGGFASPPKRVPFNPDTFPNAVITGGFGGANTLDVAYAGTRILETLNGDGVDGFTSSSQTLILPQGESLHGIASANFNGDARIDVATLSAQPRVVLLLNQGTGAPPQTLFLPLSTPAVDLAAADITGDGHPDLVTVDASGLVTLLGGRGDGAFYPSKTYPSAEGATRVLLADATGDGRKDILVAGNGFVSVLPGNGNGEFGAAVTLPTQVNATAFAATDLNLDGFVDVALASSAASGITVLLNPGNGVFGQPTTLPTNHPVSALTTGDFNSDGRPDLIAAQRAGNTVSVFLNTSTAPKADARVQLFAGPNLGLLTPYIRYEVRVTNNGPAVMNAATVRSVLPAGLSASSSECTASSGTVTCGFGPLAAGAAQSRFFTVPLGLLNIGLPYTVTATRVAGEPEDPNAANNQDSRRCTAISILLVSCD